MDRDFPEDDFVSIESKNVPVAPWTGKKERVGTVLGSSKGWFLGNKTSFMHNALTGMSFTTTQPTAQRLLCSEMPAPNEA